MHYFIFLTFLTIGSSISEGRLRAEDVDLGPNPGAIVRLRKPAIDSLIGHGTTLFARYAAKIPIPDVKATVGGVEFETTNAKFSDIQTPRIEYQLIAPNQLKGSIELPGIGLQSDFKAVRHVAFGGSQKDAGELAFSATNVKAAFEIQLDQFGNGVPKIADFKCTASMGNAKLKVLGAKEKFPVQVLTVAAKGIRPVYNSQVCAIANKVMNEQVNRFLAMVPDVLRISNKLAIKFQAKPVIDEDYVELRLFEKVITTRASPFAPAPFLEAPNDNSMVAVFLSDAVINDVLYQAHTNKLLEFAIDKNSPSLLYSLIKLACAEGQVACLGNQIPSLVEKYGPDAAVEFTFTNTKAPTVEFLQDKATFHGALSTSLDVTPAKTGKRVHEFTSTVDLAGSLQVKIKDGRIYGKVTVDKADVDIDKEDSKEYEQKISNTIKQIVENHVNGDLLLKGLPLRLPFGVAVTEPLVKFSQHTLQAHAGFEAKPQISSDEKDDQNDENVDTENGN